MHRFELLALLLHFITCSAAAQEKIFELQDFLVTCERPLQIISTQTKFGDQNEFANVVTDFDPRLVAEYLQQLLRSNVLVLRPYGS